MYCSAMTMTSNLNSDRFAVRNAVTAIRNSFMRVDGRQLLVGGGAERRASVRVALNVPVTITAADVDQGEIVPRFGEGSLCEGVCLDISLGGLGLIHPLPLPADFAIVRFDIPADDPVCLAVEVMWSNRSEDDSWTSGVRIIGLANLIDS